MKKLITLVGAMALALLSSSCLQNNTTLSLNKDGSGTITETTVIGEQMLAMMAAGGGEGGDPLVQMVAQAKAKGAEAAAKMGEGVTLKEVKPLNEGGKKGMIIVYAFEDINKLKYAFGQSIGDDNDDKDPLDISYKDGVLTLNNKFEPAEGGEEEAPDELDEAGLAMAEQMMGDVRMTLQFAFPGGIAETNAEYIEGNKVTMMDIEFGKLIAQQDKFKEFMKAQPGSPAEAKDMLKGVDGIKIETAEKLTIKLK